MLTVRSVRFHGRMYDPFRVGKEWWHICELLRLLLLTSCVGFFSRSCYIKLLVALIIALAFLVIFLWHRPYRRGFHNLIQGLGMTAPIVGLSYAFAGGWEEAAAECGIHDVEKSVAYDSVSLAVVHFILIAPPIVMGLFTICATFWTWRQAKKWDRIAAMRSKLTMDTTSQKQGGHEAANATDNESSASFTGVQNRSNSSTRSNRVQPSSRDVESHEDDVPKRAQTSTRDAESQEDKSQSPMSSVSSCGSWSTWSSLSDIEKSLSVTGALLGSKKTRPDKMKSTSTEDSKIVKQLRQKVKQMQDAHGKVVDQLREENETLKKEADGKGKDRNTRHHRGQKRKEKALAKMVYKIDADHSGNLDIAEFCAMCQSDDIDAVRKLFDLLDQDKSGTLEFAEITHLLSTDKEAIRLASAFAGLRELVKKKKSKRRKSKLHTPRKRRSISKRRKKPKLDALSEDGERRSKRRQQQRRSSLVAAMGGAIPPPSIGHRYAGLHTAVKMHSWAARVKRTSRGDANRERAPPGGRQLRRPSLADVQASAARVAARSKPSTRRTRSGTVRLSDKDIQALSAKR